MTRRKPIMPKNWHCWTFSTNCGTNKVSKPPPTISDATKGQRKAYFPNICEEEKIQLSNVQNKAELAVISILDASKDQIPF